MHLYLFTNVADNVSILFELILDSFRKLKLTMCINILALTIQISLAWALGINTNLRI